MFPMPPSLISHSRERIGNGWCEPFNIPKFSCITNAWHFSMPRVNVGDWAAPITSTLPTIAYFLGIEGSPPTASIAAANILTTIRYQIYQERITDLAPRALVPFPIMSKHTLEQAEDIGGVCFNHQGDNIGGQGIVGLGTLNCEAISTAGAAYFPDVLRNLFSQFPTFLHGGEPNKCPPNHRSMAQHIHC